tara:strand:- start:4010 stop:4225 length:216 start_codon:yes stop_codon:yes gene_type:complete
MNKVTIKQSPDSYREVQLNGTKIGCTYQRNFGRFGKGAWRLKLTVWNPNFLELPREFVTLAELRTAVAEAA